MSATQLRIGAAALLFIAIFLFGFWLSRTGKPYNQVLFTVHKLLTLGVIVFLGSTAYQVHQASPLTPAQIALLVLTALCFVANLATGALLSIERTMPEFVLRLHQVIPYLTLLSSAASLYWLLLRGSQLVTTLKN